MDLKNNSLGWLLIILLMFGLCSTCKAQEKYPNEPRGLQELSGTVSVFGPLVLPGDLGDWELDPVINRSVGLNARFPKNTYTAGYHRQNIFGEGYYAGIYNHKLKASLRLYNYDKGGPMLSVSISITIFKKK